MIVIKFLCLKFCLVMFYIYIPKMKINKKIIIFTYDYPTGNSENTFIQFEISKLLNDFDDIEIVPQKNLKKNRKKIEKKIKVNLGLSKQLNNQNIILNFFLYTIFSTDFYKELNKILFKKNFFLKLKISIIEITQSEIAYKWIKEHKIKNSKNIIFYSFWSNFILLTFKKLKEVRDIKTVSRALGSDLNGFIKNDSYVPFIDTKFLTLNKIILLGDYQKNKLKKFNLNNQIEIAPLGVFAQTKNTNNKIFLNEPITFVSCGNLIEIKNNSLMIDFLKKFSEMTNKKIKYIMIGRGILKKKIIKKIQNHNNIIFEYHEYVDNFVNFLKKNKIHFFLNFSSQEGMPFTIMESMSCGIPTIASNIPPNKYLVNKNGFLFDLDDFNHSIEDMIINIKETIDDKEKYYHKSQKSYDFIHNNLINSDCYNKFKFIIDNL